MIDCSQTDDDVEINIISNDMLLLTCYTRTQVAMMFNGFCGATKTDTESQTVLKDAGKLGEAMLNVYPKNTMLVLLRAFVNFVEYRSIKQTNKKIYQTCLSMPIPILSYHHPRPLATTTILIPFICSVLLCFVVIRDRCRRREPILA